MNIQDIASLIAKTKVTDIDLSQVDFGVTPGERINQLEQNVIGLLAMCKAIIITSFSPDQVDAYNEEVARQISSVQMKSVSPNPPNGDDQ